MAYLPELHRCTICKVDLGAENGDGICGDCEAAWEQIGEYVQEHIDRLEQACQMALDHGERKMYSWRDVRRNLRVALRPESEERA